MMKVEEKFMLPKTVRFALTMILVHAATVVLHAAAHVQLDVNLPFWSNVFVVVDIIILPLVAGLLLGRRLYQVGGWLLFLSMVGAFIFGFYYHFGLESPDHVAHAPATMWGFIFQLTSVLLFIFEGLGAWAGWRCLAQPTHRGEVKTHEPS